jgi:CRP/FNR family cyclic AMP-dependent transcriptional regulator
MTAFDKAKFPGLKEWLFPRPPGTGSSDLMTRLGRSLFAPQDSLVARRPRKFADFLRQVGLFEGFKRADLLRLSRILHQRDYADGEYVCEEGNPGAALFIVQRGVVEVVSGAGEHEVPIALLEPPATFEEAAAVGTGAPRWFSVRARGPVTLLALGKSDLDALIVNFPSLANKILLRLAAVLADRLQMRIDAEILGHSEKRERDEP